MSAMDNYIDEWYDAALASGQGFKTPEERQAYIDSLGDPEEHPMFATDPDKLAAHPLTDAFRQLNEEDRTKYELVIMYKEEGNSLMKKGDKGGFREAVMRYTHALSFIEPALAEIQEVSAAPASNDATEEIKSASVLAFERQQQKYAEEKAAYDAFEADQEAKIALARRAEGHEAGTKPIKVDISKKKPTAATNTNPLLNLDDIATDSTPEQIRAKKAEVVAAMEDYQGEKVLTFEEVVKRSEQRNAKIADQAGISVQVTPETVNQTRSQILGNRAMAQLSLKNYGSCVRDCHVAIYYWPHNYKAHYRKCKALAALHKYQMVMDAIDVCQKLYDATSAQATSADTKAFAEVQKIGEIAREQLKKQERTRLKAVVAAEKKKQTLLEVFRVCSTSYGVKFGVPTGVAPAGSKAATSYDSKSFKSSSSSYLGDSDEGEDIQPRRTVATDVRYLQQLENTTPFLDPEGSGDMRFPTIFLYPQYNQLDIIQAAEPQNMIVDYLAHMFPEIEAGNAGSAAPWDILNEYVVSKLVCYVHLNGGQGGTIHSEKEWLSYFDSSTVLTKEEIAVAAGSIESSADSFCHVHLGCTVGQVLRADKHVLPGGLLHVLVFVNKSKAHKKFLQTCRRHRAEMYRLSPSGEMTKQL